MKKCIHRDREVRNCIVYSEPEHHVITVKLGDEGHD